MIEIEGVSKRFEGGQHALRELSLRIQRGELCCLVGESGSGKTTLLKIINRLVEPSAGRVRVDGVDILTRDPIELRRSIGTVFQSFALFPHLTVAENIGVVPKLLGWPASEIGARVDELLRVVELPPDEYRKRWPAELSGGQQQRVGVARALAVRPSILLMDEPFGSLDPITRDALAERTRALHRELSLTTVMVTHDMTEALLLADRIVVLHAGEVLQQGRPEELLAAPADPRVKSLLEAPRKNAARLAELAHGSESA